MHQSTLGTSETEATQTGSDFQFMSDGADISPSRVLDSGPARAARRGCLVQRYSGANRGRIVLGDDAG
jgi:hypothetical protein